MVKALSKVIWIQNDLFAKWYVRDGDEFTGNVSAAAPSTTHSTSNGSLEGTSSKTVCPFSGMARGMQGLEVRD